jgi:hypothetical protein
MKPKKCEKCKNCALNNGIRKCLADEEHRTMMIDGGKTPDYMWCYGKLYE